MNLHIKKSPVKYMHQIIKNGSYPPGQSLLSHYKITNYFCRILWDLVALCTDSSYMFVVNVTTKFVVITTNHLV